MQNSKYYFLVLTIGIFVSCSRNSVEGVVSKLEKKKDVELNSALDSLSSLDVSTFYSKISTKYKDSSQNASFKTSVRILHNEKVNALITFAKIPVINALLTRDSIQVVDKRSKCVTKESLSYIKDNFGIEFDYLNVEQLLMGLPVGYDPSEEYYRVNTPFEYVMCSHKKREVRKNERKGGREIIKYYTLNEDLKSLKELRIESPDDSTTINISYKTRELIDNFLVPENVLIEIVTPKQNIIVEMNYNKTKINEEESIHFVIPENYELCK